MLVKNQNLCKDKNFGLISKFWPRSPNFVKNNQKFGRNSKFVIKKYAKLPKFVPGNI